MGTRLDRRRDRVKQEISIFQVLLDCGYQVQDNEYEQQFCCDLHGDGHDVKPSARVYTDNSWYCYACQVQRDSIATIQAKEEIPYGEAIYYLESKYGLPNLPCEDDDEVYQKPRTSIDEINEVYQPQRADYAQDQRRAHAILDSLTKDQDLPLDTMLALWDVHDMVAYKVGKELMSEAKGSVAMGKLRLKAIEKVKECNNT